MYQPDFSDIQFRASSLEALVDTSIKNKYEDALTIIEQAEYDKWLADGKTHLKSFLKLQEKIDKKANQNYLEITDSTKTELYNIWLKSIGIAQFTGSKDTDRGDNYEQASIELLNFAYNENFEKNSERKFNKIIQGEADIVATKSVVDIKTKSTFVTFDKANQTTADNHFWQLWGYKKLYNKDLSHIAFCLPSYTDVDIYKAQELKTKNISEVEEIKKTKEQVYSNMNFDRFNKKSLVKLFKVDSLKLKNDKILKDTEIDENLVYELLQQCRVYLQGISNNNLHLFKN